MRLISQNGRVDVPYENVILTVGNDGIILVTFFSSDEDFVFAIYSTKEKALKVMEMLIGKYEQPKSQPYNYFQFPKDEDVEV